MTIADRIGPLLTARAAAERLGIPVRRVRAAIRTRELRAVRIGRWARVTEHDLAAWIDRLRGHRLRLDRAQDPEPVAMREPSPSDRHP
jgi:excisionase family DNA binding protein